MLRTRVADRVTLSASDAEAPEGGTARLAVRLSLAFDFDAGRLDDGARRARGDG